MHIQETRNGGYLIVEPVGRLETNTAKALDRNLTNAIQRGDTQIILDMSHLDYIGSMGLSTLLAAAKRIKAAQGELLLRGMNERVKLVFEMSGFLRLFRIADV